MSVDLEAEPAVEPTQAKTRSGWLRVRRESTVYLAAAALAAVVAGWMIKIWQANLSIPFYYSADAISSMAHFRTTIETGWYESQPRLGAPYGQHYHDYPFSDDLHPAVAKVLGVLTGGNWAAAFNIYYLATFVLIAVAAVWFLRVAGVSRTLTVVLAVLYAVAPYHFWRNETHMFLSAYYTVPLVLVVVLRLARGERVWGIRRGNGRPVPKLVGVLTGRGAGTAAIIVLQVYDGIYYAVFFGMLAALAVLVSWWRTRNHRGFVGGIVAGLVLMAAAILAMLPDIIYADIHGQDAAALFRTPADTEWYGLKFMQLILPAPGHPIPVLAKLRDWYDTNFPVPSEYPSLGLIAALGFLGLLAFGLRSIMARRPNGQVVADETDQTSPVATLRQLSMLTWWAFALSTVGGVGVVLSFFVNAIRGWNRMSIFIALMCLAAVGLAVQLFVGWLVRKLTRHPGTKKGSAVAARRLRVARPVAALLVLVVGVFDQNLTTAAPDYAATAYTFNSDKRFFAAVESKLPAGSMVFQLPYMPFPESPPKGGATENDQLRPFLLTTTLRWSGGGIKGRPQTDWVEQVSSEFGEQMTRDLAIIGFSGIVIDTTAADGTGATIINNLSPYTGDPVLTSDDGRWVFLSLAKERQLVEATMSVTERANLAASLTHMNEPD